MKEKLILIIIVLVLTASAAGVEPAGSEFYGFARTMHEKYGVKGYSFSRPWTAKMVARFLENVQGVDLTDIEKGELDIIRKRLLPGERETLLRFSDENGTAEIDLSGRLGYLSEYIRGVGAEADYIIYTSGITAQGSLGDTFSYYMTFNDETANGLKELLSLENRYTYYKDSELVTETFNGIYYLRRELGLGWFNYQRERDEAYFDRTDVITDLELGFCTVNAGKFSDSWGPGLEDGLFLSDNAASFTQVRFVFNAGALRLISLTGGLRTSEYDLNSGIEVENGDIKYPFRKKYYAAHRLEADLGRLFLGFNEAVVYADKDIQLGYMIPMNIFWSEQHYQGDRDNTVMGCDASYDVVKGLRIYGELFLDDVSFRQINDFRHTKAAYLFGASWHPLLAGDLNVTAEYERVNPFVYTHRFNVDSYTHYYTGLGSSLQPNGDSLTLSVTQKIAPFTLLALRCGVARHGGNYVDTEGQFKNVGGDTEYPDLLSTDDNSTSLSFLGGRRSSRFTAELGMKTVLRNFRLWKKIPVGKLALEGWVSYGSTDFTHDPDDAISAPPGEKSWNISFSATYNYGY